MSRGSSEIAKNEENAFLCLGWRAYNSLITKLSCKKDGTECGYWCLFIGLLKAFDTVDHKVLSRKLNHYGIRGIVNKWFSLYLCSRQQFVSIGNTNSRSCSRASVILALYKQPAFGLKIFWSHTFCRWYQLNSNQQVCRVPLLDNDLYDFSCLSTWLEANKIAYLQWY